MARAGFHLGIITLKPSSPPLLSTYSSTQTDRYTHFAGLLFFHTELDSQRGIQARKCKAEVGAANTTAGGSSHPTKGEVLPSGQPCLSSKPG